MLLDHYSHTREEDKSLSYRAKRFGYTLYNYSAVLYGLKGCKDGKPYKLMPNIIQGGFYGSYYKYIKDGKRYMHEALRGFIYYARKERRGRRLWERAISRDCVRLKDIIIFNKYR